MKKKKLKLADGKHEDRKGKRQQKRTQSRTKCGEKRVQIAMDININVSNAADVVVIFSFFCCEFVSLGLPVKFVTDCKHFSLTFSTFFSILPYILIGVSLLNLLSKMNTYECVRICSYIYSELFSLYICHPFRLQNCRICIWIIESSSRLTIFNICESLRFHLHLFKSCCLNSSIHLSFAAAHTKTHSSRFIHRIDACITGMLNNERKM